MTYKVYDSQGKIVRGGFPDRQSARNWIFAKGNNPGFRVY
jgi:hypothetical protein